MKEYDDSSFNNLILKKQKIYLDNPLPNLTRKLVSLPKSID